MSQADKLADARLQAMEYARRRIKEVGMDEFDKEMEWRINHKVAICISPQELNEASGKIKQWAYESVVAMTLLGLRDEFDFGKVRLNRLNDRMTLKARCLNDNFATWDDYKKILYDETGIKVAVVWER